MNKPSLLVTLITTWFYAGKSPIMPGTVGTLAALPFAYIIHSYAGSLILFIMSMAVFFLGWWAANMYEETTGTHDSSAIVIDEVAGIWLLLSLYAPTWQWYSIAFITFRIFDILKPWPISIADKNIGGGFGVMLDDILAALYPMIIMFLYVHVFLAIM